MNQVETKHEIESVEVAVSGTKSLRIPQTVIVRAPGLLPMLYTITELGQELNIGEFNS